MISEKILRPKLAEIGRIKIGGLDATVRKTKAGTDWQAPVKYDHFVVTGMERDEKGNFRRDDAIHATIGAEPRELEIRLLYNDPELNFRTELALYSGKTCCCRGDGIKAEKLDRQTGELIQVQCPCPELSKESNGCKPHGVLTCLIEQSQLCGGVYRFTTTSWNSINSIKSSLQFISVCTGGKIAGLPLVLKYFKKATVRKNGQTAVIPVVTIVFPGSPVQLLEQAIENEKKRLSAGIKMELLEAGLRREIAAPIFEDEDDIPEFHPEEPPDNTMMADAGMADQIIISDQKSQPEQCKLESIETMNESALSAVETGENAKTSGAERSTLKFFKCESCGHVHTTDSPGTLTVCVKCGHAAMQKQFPDLESARKYVYPAKSTEPGNVSEAAKPGNVSEAVESGNASEAVESGKDSEAVEPVTVTLSLGEIAEEIAKLRGSKCLMQADFVKMAKAACGKVMLDPNKMTIEQASRLLELVRNFGGKK